MNNHNPEQKIIRKQYSPQFKDQALERIAKEGVPQVANGLAESLLYSRKAQRQKEGDSLENQKLQQAKLARLKKENSRHVLLLKIMCLNTSKYITIENDFSR